MPPGKENVKWWLTRPGDGANIIARIPIEAIGKLGRTAMKKQTSMMMSMCMGMMMSMMMCCAQKCCGCQTCS